MRNVRPKETEHAVAGFPAPQSSDLPAVTNVAFERNLFDTPAMVGMTVVGALLAAVFIVPILTLPAAIRSIVFAVAAVVAAALVWVFIATARRAGCRKVRRVLGQSADSDLGLRIKDLLPTVRSLQTQSLVKEAARVLATGGRAGSTIRIAPSGQASAIDPIAVPFEPRRFGEIAELDSADLRQAGMDAAGSGGPHTGSRNGPSTAAPRGVRRNLMLKGGWILLACIGLSWVARAVEAFQRGTVTVQFMLMTLVLLALLLIPAEYNWIVGRQWLAVPGGIVVRKGSWLTKRWDLLLFDRRESVLFLYKHLRHTWVLVVADAKVCEATIGTVQELESALSAWLSPLPPPPIEQLSDLL